MRPCSSAILCLLVCLGGSVSSNAGAHPVEATALHTPAPVASFFLARGGRIGAGFCKDGLLRVWALPDGRLLNTIQISTNDFLFAAFSRDGSRVATGFWNGKVVVWDPITAKPLANLHLPTYASSIAFSPDNQSLAVATSFGKVQVVGLGGTGERFELGDVTGGTQAVVFSPDGALIGTADSDTQVRVYDSRTGRQLASNQQFLMDPLAIDFTADSRQVVAGGADRVAKVFDAGTGQAIQTLKKQAEPIGYLEVSPDGKLLATVLVNSTSFTLPAPVRIWETHSGRQRAEWMPPSGVAAGTWAADGHFLAATIAPDGVHVWNPY